MARAWLLWIEAVEGHVFLAVITIRPAQLSDAPRLAALTGELGYPCSTDEIAARAGQLLGKPEYLVIVAVLGTEVCGWLQAHGLQILEYGFRIEILGLVVGAKARRQGVGKQLVLAAEEWGRAIGAGSIVVRSNTQRAESHIFYPALGFTLTKTQASYRKILPAGERG